MPCGRLFYTKNQQFCGSKTIGLLKLWKNASVSVGVSVEVVLLRVVVNNTGSLSV